MDRKQVIAIFDVGKTNKKLFLIDEDYNIVAEYAQKLEETVDEDGFPCDDLPKLRALFSGFLLQIIQNTNYQLIAVNISAYGASLVYIDDKGEPVFPLYNYLKPYPSHLQSRFYLEYGGEATFSLSSASPVLGSLNSGMQLYRLKYEKPEQFAKVKFALHLPQYLSFLISGVAVSDITSIGCHTNMWHFSNATYQPWLRLENLQEKLAPIVPSTAVNPCSLEGHSFQCGVGLHDSSAALIPYLVSEQAPFVLLSTGTWCIALNPFNQSSLTATQLQNDCLCYLSYKGKPVKAARLFAGHFHEKETQRIAAHYKTEDNFYTSVAYNKSTMALLAEKCGQPAENLLNNVNASPFSQRDLQVFKSADEAYHQLMADMVAQQVHSLQFVLDGSAPIRKIFVDGGFSNNQIFMRLLAQAFPQYEVFASQVAQASAIGAALAIHSQWNSQPIPQHLLQLTQYYD